MRKIIAILLLTSLLGFGQNRNKEIIRLLEECETIKKNENYRQLISVANKGLSLSKEDTYLLSRFSFYKAYGYEYDNNQYEKATPYFEASWRFAKKNKNLKEETLAIMRLSYLYYSTKQFQKREELIKYIKEVLDTTKSIYTQGILNGSLGEYHLDKSEIEPFIGYKLKAIEYRKKFPKEDASNIVNIGISYSQIGQAYIKMKQFDKGIEYSNYAKPYMEGSSNSLAFLYNDYIKCYTGKNNLDSITKYYKEVYKLVSKEDSLHISVSSANRYMAEYFIAKDDISKASFFAKKAIRFAEKSNDEEILMEARVSQGKLLYRQKQFNAAIEVLKQASTHAYEFDKNSFIVINQLLSESYAKIGDWKQAFYYQSIYTKANEKVLSESAKQSIANAEAKFQNRNKQEKINLLSAENKVKNLQIENTRKTQIYLGIAFLFLLTIVTLLYRQNVNRKKTNKKLEKLNTELDLANKTKARFFSIINHDLRGPVANLISFLHLQENHPELLDEESEKRLKQKTTEGAENLLSSMEDLLLWSKSQIENFEPQPKKITVDSLFSDTANHFSNFENISITYENTQNIELYADENYLKTIIRNLTGNAIKALEKTENPKIEWKAYTKDNKVILSIHDNGPGGTKEQFKALYDETTITGISSGLGLHLIRDLAKIIKAEITVKTSNDFGTTIHIIL
ncbi:tetratricopeptide repeat-containing sensor histidine kinase [Flavobacterium terrae]|uniref:histidine kinase n=1 Tax=Flavobacterium terrae TaxID=415425 RepID=A0A1M6AC98_9FLAO|nr:HAMP domain-containing sensor histidine kinase [Flavobacterium terrae]SHI34008.1 Histidine kinase-, DNA gyrase B-, and HSP90-like ATPase [Flavobacterium terrae]